MNQIKLFTRRFSTSIYKDLTKIKDAVSETSNVLRQSKGIVDEHEIPSVNY